jgi:hypothetical protein
LEWQSSNRVIRNHNRVISNHMQRGKWRFRLRQHCRIYSATSMGVSSGAVRASRVCAEKHLNTKHPLYTDRQIFGGKTPLYIIFVT